MDAEIPHLRRLDRLIWTIIAITAGINFAVSVFGTFRIIWTTFLAAAVTNLLLYLTYRFYTTTRKDPGIASALICTAEVIAFAAVGAPLSYVAASTGYPLWDATIAAWDKQLGFDWMGWLAIMNHHPPCCTGFSPAAYSSFTVQTAAVVLAMALTGHVLRLRTIRFEFHSGYPCHNCHFGRSASAGRLGLHAPVARKLSSHPYRYTGSCTLAVFHGLRDGSFRDLVAQGAQGIITFPSLHTAVAVLLIIAMWPHQISALGWRALEPHYDSGDPDRWRPLLC